MGLITSDFGNDLPTIKFGVSTLQQIGAEVLPECAEKGREPNGVSDRVQQRETLPVFKAHRLVYHSPLGLRVLKKKKGAS